MKPAGNMRRSFAATQNGAMFAVGSIVRANFRPVGVGKRGTKPQFLPYDALVAAKKGDYTKLLMLQVKDFAPLYLSKFHQCTSLLIR